MNSREQRRLELWTYTRSEEGQQKLVDMYETGCESDGTQPLFGRLWTGIINAILNREFPKAAQTEFSSERAVVQKLRSRTASTIDGSTGAPDFRKK